MSSVGPTKAQVLQLFQRHERELVTALSSADLRKLSNDLLKNVIITKEMKNIFASLDLDRLDPKLVARYMLSKVYQRIENGDVGFHNLVCALSGAGGCVRQLVRIINDELTKNCNTKDPNDSMTLHSDDVSVLITCLIKCSHKWEELAIALEFPEHMIAECGNAASNKTRLYRVLTNWLTADNKKPTLATLKAALASVIVEEGRLANDLEENYMKTLRDKLGFLPEITVQDSTQFQLVHQPSDTEVADHRSALLEVQVSPSESVSYQWMKDSQPLSDSSDFSGTSTEILLINQASIGAEGEYCCLVNCGSNELTSSLATLSVMYPPDKKSLTTFYTREVPNSSWPLGGTKTFIDLLLIKKQKSQQKHNEIYIEAEMEALAVDKVSIKYKEAFEMYEAQAMILVEGRPGSGKTTLATKIAKDWADGIALKNADRVFLISLRKDMRKSEIFEAFYHSQAEEYLRKIEDCQGDKTCFILDGYDEFNPKDKDSSILYKIINKSYLPRAMTIITSRPTATIELRQEPEVIRIEIFGFTKENFDKYINSYPFDDLNNPQRVDTANSKLKKHLKACNNVLNMCYLPINANIICFLFNQDVGYGQLPKTETQIYEQFVIAIVLHKLRQHDDFVQLHSLKELSGENETCFKKLCSLAFKMTTKNMQIVDKKSLEIESLNKTPFRGLLAADRIAERHGLNDIATFLHLTLQEYLAAYYLSSLNDDRQTEMIRMHKGKKHLQTMFKFYCGLVDLTKKYTQFADIISPHNNLLFIAHCIYESQQPHLCTMAIQLVFHSITLGFCILTPADCTALGYVVSNASSEVTSLNIQSCQLYEDSIHKRWIDKTPSNETILDNGIQSASFGIMEKFKAQGTLMFMNVSYKQTDKFYPSLCKIMEFDKNLSRYRDNRHNALACRWDRDVNNCIMLNSTHAKPLVEALVSCNKLKILSIVDNESGEGSAQIIEGVLRRNMHFEMIMIRYGLTPSCIPVFANTIRYCQQLQSLTLEANKLDTTEAAVLLESLKYCKKLCTLTLSNCEIGPQNAKALAFGIHELPLKVVLLIGNNIGPEGARALADQDCFKTVNILNISHNAIGSDGAKAIASIAKKSSNTLHTLVLAGNQIDKAGIAQLGKILKRKILLQNFNVTLNPICSEGAATLGNSLIYSLKLLQLSVWGCNLTSDGLIALVETTCFSSLLLLEILDMTDNNLCSRGMPALANGLKKLQNLEELYLSHNQIDCSGARALAEGLKYSRNLRVLNISHNKIGSIGAVAISNALIHNNIKFINMSNNCFGPGNEALLVALVCLARRGHPELLDLANNYMGTDSVVTLVIHLIFCKYQMKLNISDNDTSPDVSQFINDLKQVPVQLTVYLKN